METINDILSVPKCCCSHMTVETSGEQELEQLDITQPNWTEELDNVTHPNAVQMENELKIH
jgi:hypothetical protein